MRYPTKALINVLAAGLVLGLTPSSAAAAGVTAGFTISPPVVELSADPGQTLTKTFTVFNESNRDQTATTNIANFLPDGESGDRVAFTEEATAFPLASWMTVTPDSQVVPGRDSVDFTLTIKLPADASPGGHFGSIGFTPRVPPAPNSVRIEQSVTALVLLRVSGDVAEQAAVESFGVRPKTDESGTAQPQGSLFRGGPLEFAARIRNEGNVHVKPSIAVAVSGPFGFGEATTDNSAPGGTVGNVLPGSSRTYLIPSASSFLPGRYRADLTATYGEGRQLTASTSFWILPTWLRIAGPILLLLLGAFFFILWRRRRSPRKQAARKQAVREPATGG